MKKSPKHKITPELMASHLMDKFGFIVIPCTSLIAETTTLLWGHPVEGQWRCIGKTTLRIWQRQADAVNDRWPRFIAEENRTPPSGMYKFYKFVPNQEITNA